MSIFDTLLSNSDVEQAVLDCLNLWLDEYLSEVERTHALSVPTLARPRSAQASFDLDNWQEAQLPALIIVCDRTVGTSERTSERTAAWFEVQAGVLLTDTSEANARRVTHLHQAAIDGIIEQQPLLISPAYPNGFAVESQLQGRETRLPDVDNRTLAIAMSTFHVLPNVIVNPSAGPLVPSQTPESPQPDWPTVQTLNLTFTTVPASQQINDPS